ncbi:MAG: KAP family NTPase, partial [Phycisphaerales bacterium]|nr:KAP family NTPase [Phycisphaerales bacterium]
MSSKADDRLNRAPFAERVAGILRGMPKGTSMVVGIHGPWGDGKTTVLNMLQADLEADGETATVEFNPWRFTDEPSMLAGFFRVLAGVIRAKLTTPSEAVAGWIEKIGRYASVVDTRLGRAGEVAEAHAEASLEELRSRLSEALTSADKRIVVLVDDIDRLDKHETHTLFRLIKACADFPNVCYVLAFDDVAVAKSLGERFGGGNEASGRAFLEKIIQVPLKLPVAMKEDLRSLCFQQVDQAITAAGIELSKEDAGGFVSGFDRGVSIRLDTPRAAKRYGNGLMFALPMLKGEVNIVDLLLIESVRAFYPAIYEIIRVNHDEFSGVESEHRQPGYDGPRAWVLLKPVVDALPSEEQEAIKSLLTRLFPRLRSAYGGGRYGSDWLLPWAKAKRICSPDYCPRYFSYSVPTRDVRDSEMDALYVKAANAPASEVGEDIVAYFTGGKARRVIERMRQREASTSPQAVASLCVAIAANAKHIPNPPSPFSFAEAVSQAGILISRLIERLPGGTPRVTLAKQVIEAADPLWFGAEVLRWLHVTDDADKADSNTLTKEEVKEVGKALVERIKARARAGEPLFNVDVPQEQSLLYEWWRVEGREPVQAHLASVFAKDPKNIALFLQAMAPRSWGEGDVLPRVGKLDGDQLKNIKLIYDLDALAQLIREHLPGNFENPQWYPDSSNPIGQRLAEQFMFVYNKSKKDGEPPDRGSSGQADDTPA